MVNYVGIYESKKNELNLSWTKLNWTERWLASIYKVFVRSLVVYIFNSILII